MNKCRLCGKFVRKNYGIDHVSNSPGCMAKMQNELRRLVESHIEKYGIDSIKVNFDNARKLSATAE